MERSSDWNSSQLLETSFWDSSEDSETEEQEEFEVKRAEREGNKIETEYGDGEEDTETDVDSYDEGIGSMNSAGQSEPLEPSERSVIPVGSIGRRRAFDRRGRTGRTLGQSVGGLLSQMKMSLQSRGTRGSKVFGLPLAQLLDEEGGRVPKIVGWATGLIEARGPEAWEGIYRLSGQATTVAALKNSIKCGRKPKPSDAESIHSLAALLKVT